MKQLTCEMCGSTELIKQDGFFVCQTCGTKYSVEEAKKMMIEGTVDVQGTVKVDRSIELEKLYQAARNAKAAGGVDTALIHYEKISALAPNDWEAMFYSVILKFNSYKNGEIEIVASRIMECIPTIFTLIKSYVENEDDKKKAVEVVHKECAEMAIGLVSSSINFTKSLNKTNTAVAFTGVFSAISSSFDGAKQVEANRVRCRHISNIMIDVGDLIKKNFGTQEEWYKEKISLAYMDALLLEKLFLEGHPILGTFLFTKEEKNKIIGYIKEVDPEAANKLVETKKIEKDENVETSAEKKSGCYVATCVYGSYDCPEVWTLRRYRDNTLGSTWYGRAFIRTYYAISPTLVKWFGDTKWFKKMWKGKLDRMVKKLQNNGVENTPYKDKEW